MRLRIGIVAGALMLAGCGKIFPFGERLLPASYGPPFGSALKDNQPHHPHNPAAEERHSAADAARSRTYRSHQACHAALLAAISSRPDGQVQRISSVESVGHYRSANIVHEQRCSDYVLSSRSWCVTGDQATPAAGKRTSAPSRQRAAEAITGTTDPARSGTGLVRAESSVASKVKGALAMRHEPHGSACPSSSAQPGQLPDRCSPANAGDRAGRDLA